MARPSSGKAELADRLHSLAVRLLRHVRRDDHLQGVSPARLSALSVLVFGQPCSPSQLARIEQVSRPSMTRLLQGMARDGLVELRPVDGDGRRRLAQASARGRALVRRGRARRVAATAQLLASLAPAERAAVRSAVSTLEGRLSRERLPPARR